MTRETAQSSVEKKGIRLPFFILLLICFVLFHPAVKSYGQPPPRAAAARQGYPEKYNMSKSGFKPKAAPNELERLPAEGSSYGSWPATHPAPVEDAGVEGPFSLSLWVTQELDFGQLYAEENGGVLLLTPRGQTSVSGGLISVGARARPAILRLQGLRLSEGQAPIISVRAEESFSNHGARFEPEWELDCTGAHTGECVLRIGGQLFVPSGVKPSGVIRISLYITATN